MGFLRHSTRTRFISLNANEIAWLTLRIVYAWMFLYPAIGLLRNWSTTVQTTALLFPWKPAVFAGLSLILMIFGAAMILFGVYGRLAGAGLCVFCLGGARVHYKLASMAGDTQLSSEASRSDSDAVSILRALAVVGHVTSAEKNFVLASVGFFFALRGTGPFSVIDGPYSF